MFNVEDLGRIVRVTMQRAPVNAINNDFVAGFNRVLDGIAEKKDLLVLHIRSDQKAFSAGADLAQVQTRFAMERGADAMVKDIRGFHRLFDRLEALPCVTIAEIGGTALGGGYELALACDLRIAANEAKIGLPEAKLGLIPGAGGTQRLTRLCGPGVAARIILACEVVDGKTARDLGMVQWAVPAAVLPGEAEALAKRVSEFAAPAIQVAKRCMAKAVALSPDGFETELQGTHGLMATTEARTRIKEFFAQRGR
ncbi:enoyl-CoA hydratase/isomerase family protein [Noviherbaspirillum denitrificans]|uniref:Enoyl-CoA hydratase n=1 Tax=Noviherbaspirillum denitrificans TaxID=1968433 RepID=A0A254T8Q8_9BURK|nr:enoyl-CoA hydratase/isomerase family protein [Noviherbaspirillum denitrificans]OWW19019.1 enoyl-CoA hydratase [Noviherbaspirillum denitrificans]